MPLRIVWRSDRQRWTPVWECDHCGAPITDYRNGNVEWQIEGAAKPDAAHGGAFALTHKGCCRAFEAAHGGRSTWRWAPLGAFVSYLATAVQLDRAGAAAQRELLDSW